MPQPRNDHDASRPIVRYDVARKSVSITFQGQTHVLPETFPSYDDAMIAGYGFVRAQGWHGGV